MEMQLSDVQMTNTYTNETKEWLQRLYKILNSYEGKHTGSVNTLNDDQIEQR